MSLFYQFIASYNSSSTCMLGFFFQAHAKARKERQSALMSNTVVLYSCLNKVKSSFKQFLMHARFYFYITAYQYGISTIVSQNSQRLFQKEQCYIMSTIAFLKKGHFINGNKYIFSTIKTPVRMALGRSSPFQIFFCQVFTSLLQTWWHVLKDILSQILQSISTGNNDTLITNYLCYVVECNSVAQQPEYRHFKKTVFNKSLCGMHMNGFHSPILQTIYPRLVHFCTLFSLVYTI